MTGAGAQVDQASMRDASQRLTWDIKAYVRQLAAASAVVTGKPDESFEPLITLQVGVKTIVLVDHLDAAAGKMFAHLFQSDTRRFWHGHN